MSMVLQLLGLNLLALFTTNIWILLYGVVMLNLIMICEEKSSALMFAYEIELRMYLVFRCIITILLYLVVKWLSMSKLYLNYRFPKSLLGHGWNCLLLNWSWSLLAHILFHLDAYMCMLNFLHISLLQLNDVWNKNVINCGGLGLFE